MESSCKEYTEQTRHSPDTMNLKRHHIVYSVLVVSLMITLVVFLVPGTPDMSFTSQGLDSAVPGQVSNTADFTFEIATSSVAHEKGLSGREYIDSEYGMLFVFEKPSRVGFWMKDMRTSIDIIWLSETGTILGIEDSVSPETYRTRQTFYPPAPVMFVLETRAGEARRKGWVVGTQIQLPAPYGLR